MQAYVHYGPMYMSGSYVCAAYVHVKGVCVYRCVCVHRLSVGGGWGNWGENGLER